MFKKKHLFIVGAARFHDLLYVSVRNKDLDNQDVAHSAFCAYDQGTTHFNGKSVWDTVAMTVARKPSEIMLAISAQGDVYSYVGGNEGKEKIKAEREDIRNLNTIVGKAYACGMQGQVFRRDGANKWVDISVPKEANDGKDSGLMGFESISGYSDDELYGVGWSGQIWMRNKGEWEKTKSPTDEILTAVTCAPDGHVYIVGRNGTFIRGRGQQWDAIDIDAKVDFWDVHWFNNRIYLSSQSRLYEYVNNSFKPLDMGQDRPESCLKLTSAEGVMWSIGTTDIFLFDGSNWKRVE